jgi:hypothetical protein
MTLEALVSGSSLLCSVGLVVAALVGASGLLPQLQMQPDAVLATLVLAALSGAEAFTAWEANK